MKDKQLTIYEIRQMKAYVESIERSGKIFSLFGGYNIIRRSLMARGWLEKFEKPPKIYKQQEEASLSDEDDDGMDEVNEPQPKVVEETEQCQITARLLRNSTSNLIWTLRSNTIDYKFLEKHQIINHFRGSWSLTTKAGLLQHFKLLAWYSDVDETTIYPRAFRLFDDDDLEAFTDDFRLTACVGFLKILTLKSNSDSSASFVQENVSFAITQLENFIKFKKNEDLEDPIFQKIPAERWNNFLENYQNLKNGNYSNFTIPAETLSHCSDLLDQLYEISPQSKIDGTRNIWIVKPAARSRGRGIFICDKFSDVMKVADTTYSRQKARFVVQKYIERPLLIYSTKFDIRQWFLVTDWNPLTIWIYKQSYLRFCSHQFSLVDFHASIHLNNNAIQKYYTNDVTRSNELPEENMWTCTKFQQYLASIGHSTKWKDHIYPSMKKCILCAVLCGQETVDQRKNSFELYGADFIIDEQYNPWLIEINSSPSMDSSTSITDVLCSAVLDDTIKVVCDRKVNRGASVGDFELLYKGQTVQAPHYSGASLIVDAVPIRPPKPPRQLPPVIKVDGKIDGGEKNRLSRGKNKDSFGLLQRKKEPRSCNPIVEYKPREVIKSSSPQHVVKDVRNKSSKKKKSLRNKPKIDKVRGKRISVVEEKVPKKISLSPKNASSSYRSSLQPCELRDSVNEHNLKLLALIKSQALRKNKTSYSICLPFFYDKSSLPNLDKNASVFPVYGSKPHTRRFLRISKEMKSKTGQFGNFTENSSNCRIVGLDADFCLNSKYWRSKMN